MRARLRIALALLLIAPGLVPLPAAAGTSPAPAAGSDLSTPGWVGRIDDLVAGRHVSVAIAYQGKFIYRHDAWVERLPASNEKLLLSMALLDALGPDTTIPTIVRAEAAPVDGVVAGDLWISGRGDPQVGRATMAELAKQIAAAGIVQIQGRVMGSTSYFRREHWADGWKQHYTLDEVPFPTALAYRGNVGPSGGHINDPERRAAKELTRRLEHHGVQVDGRPGMGHPSGPLTLVASVDSQPLSTLIREMDVDSLNFYAEELAKALAAAEDGPPASFDQGARAISAFEDAQGVAGFHHHDGSGLSYDDRVTAASIVRMLWAAEAATWGTTLRLALPHAGEGTLEHRLKGVRVRAKTGTLSAVSALSGWVWLDKVGAWAEFSIVSHGLTKAKAVRMEDAIVTTVANHAP
ncbi:MAG: D-alanyl-D-alanine carboxypeptidase [Actinobacteria bacterium]|nr:D-alanyl-D-alanine carboxypeptidase [Actinomycetota bacterium]